MDGGIGSPTMPFQLRVPSTVLCPRATAPLNTAFNPPLPPGCPADRFLYVTMGYGQHSNQLIAVLNALAIAEVLNRTLIMDQGCHG